MEYAFSKHLHSTLILLASSLGLFSSCAEIIHPDSVLVLPPVISYSTSTLLTAVGRGNTLTATNTGGAITSCTSSPSLPTGLAFDSKCNISGATTGYFSSTKFTITAANAAGRSTATVNITSGTFSQQAFLKAPNNTANAWYGSAVALSSDGNTLAVGASGESSSDTTITNGPGAGSGSGAAWSGAVYIVTLK